MTQDVLGDIIKKMEQGTAKTAAAPADASPPTGPSQVETQLQKTLTKVAGSVAPTPVQPAADPIDALMATGLKLASAEQAANVAEAQMLGAAFADGFLAKMAATEAGAPPVPRSAEPVQLKQAATQGFETAADNDVQKLAGQLENVPEDELRKMAAEAGYQGVMDKVAANYQVGHDAAIQEVGNLAYGEYMKGAAEASEMLRRLPAQPQ